MAEGPSETKPAKMVMGADASELVAAIDKLIKKQEQFTATIQDTAQKSKQMGENLSNPKNAKSMEDLAASALNWAKGLALGLLSLDQALALIKQISRDQEEMARKSREGAVSLAKTLSDTGDIGAAGQIEKSLGGLTKYQSFDESVSMYGRYRAENKVVPVSEALADLATISEAASMTNVRDRGAFAGTVAGIRDATGGRIGAKEAAGIATALRQEGVSDPQSYFEHMVAMGSDPYQALRLAGAARRSGVPIEQIVSATGKISALQQDTRTIRTPDGRAIQVPAMRKGAPVDILTEDITSGNLGEYIRPQNRPGFVAMKGALGEVQYDQQSVSAIMQQIASGSSNITGLDAAKQVAGLQRRQEEIDRQKGLERQGSDLFFQNYKARIDKYTDSGIINFLLTLNMKAQQTIYNSNMMWARSISALAGRGTSVTVSSPQNQDISATSSAD